MNHQSHYNGNLSIEPWIRNRKWTSIMWWLQYLVKRVFIRIMVTNFKAFKGFLTMISVTKAKDTLTNNLKTVKYTFNSLVVLEDDAISGWLTSARSTSIKFSSLKSMRLMLKATTLICWWDRGWDKIQYRRIRDIRELIPFRQIWHLLLQNKKREFRALIFNK